MRLRNIIIILVVLFLKINFVFAQKKPVKINSDDPYESSELYSGRSKFTKFFYRLVFSPEPTTVPKNKVKKKTYKNLIQKPYASFEGKIIRNIRIETLDPFAQSIGDTIIASRNIFNKTGNKLHITSKSATIRNLLLIRKNQKFDSLLVKESERLVRRQIYVRDVSFYTLVTAKNSDSVDIFIRELDNWSILLQASFSGSRNRIQLTDNNFLGFGHELKPAYSWYKIPGDEAFDVNYFVPNIGNTYINTTIHYGTDEFGTLRKEFAVGRSFFSPFTRWAGEVNFLQQNRKKSYNAGNQPYNIQEYKFNAQDYWAGKAWQLFKGNTENDRTTNFISSARYFRMRYVEKPPETIDTLHLFSNEDFYLVGFGISTRKYVQDKFIFNFGVPEDIPVGKVYGMTVGYQEKNSTVRVYLGSRISIGNYYPWGYLSSNIEYGTFFRGSHPEQGIISAGLIYFTGLVEIGKWKFRQFLNPQITIGMNRFTTDSLSINDGYGLDGFNSSVLSGNNRLLFKLQTQAYAPWNFIGFRFGPYLTYTLGMLGRAETGFRNSKVYSLIGLGVLIKNINLVINTFQVSIAFYPVIPGIGQDVFKINSFNAGDFAIRDFETGKPASLVFE